MKSINPNTVYAALSSDDKERPVLVRGARILAQRRRFSKFTPYAPSRAERFRFEDGSELDGINAADRVRAHDAVCRLHTGTVKFPFVIE
jgi:hypothetical protein